MERLRGESLDIHHSSQELIKNLQLGDNQVKPVERVLDVRQGELCWVVGTVYMEMPLKPNVLDDISKEVRLDTHLLNTCAPTDAMIALDCSTTRTRKIHVFERRRPNIPRGRVGQIKSYRRSIEEIPAGHRMHNSCDGHRKCSRRL